uniref:Uncharacterized protein n=1 Tax=Melanopsichium pennsylvanicum 4 TaxID=1398559 RepID=A0A077R0M3_9BASI|nr:uncharacterized protein BN887_05102 [Melanopsichium pennsylvanicum 4]
MRATIPVLAAAAALGLPTLASAEVYNLLHRISTFTTTPEWEVRGTFSLPYAPISNTTGTNGSLESGNLINTLTSVQIESLLTAAQADDAAEKWYQIAIIPVASKIEEGMMIGKRVQKLMRAVIMLELERV